MNTNCKIKLKYIKKFMLFILFFIVCFLTITNINSNNVKAVTVLEEYENLYYGYNVTSGISLLEPDSLQRSYPIIDPNSNYSDYIVVSKGGTKSQSKNLVGSSMKSISEKFSSQIGTNIYGKIAIVSAGAEAAFDTSRALENRYSEYYELYDMYIERYYYIVQNLELSEIRDFLSEKFVSDINAVSGISDAKKLFEKYGTHLNTGYTMGGRMLISSYQTTTDTKKNFSTAMSLMKKCLLWISL